jgi:hypothetical protein
LREVAGFCSEVNRAWKEGLSQGGKEWLAGEQGWILITMVVLVMAVVGSIYGALTRSLVLCLGPSYVLGHCVSRAVP